MSKADDASSLRTRLTGEEMKYISLFEGMTAATALDCVLEKEGEAVIFILAPGENAKLRAAQGATVRKLMQMLRRRVVAIEYSQDPAQFIRNSFHPARLLDVKLLERGDGKKTVTVTAAAEDKGRAIGRGGRVAQRTRFLAKRYFQIEDIRIL